MLQLEKIRTVFARNRKAVELRPSVGQGTGIGGFIGLDEPNLFGRAKRVAFQWQFGRNINNFNIKEVILFPAMR